MVFRRIRNRQRPVKLSAAAGLLPLLIVLFSGSITSSDRLLAGRIVFHKRGPY